MSAGELLFARKGYTGTSIAEIAHQADVAVGSVYRLFPDKPALLAALHEKMEAAFIQAMTTAWDSEPSYPKKFGPMIEGMFDQALRVQDTMPLYAMTKELLGSTEYIPGARMVAKIEDMYALGITESAFRPIRQGIVGPIAHAMVEGGMRAWMMDPTPERRRAVEAELVTTFERAFLVR